MIFKKNKSTQKIQENILLQYLIIIILLARVLCVKKVSGNLMNKIFNLISVFLIIKLLFLKKSKTH